MRFFFTFSEWHLPMQKLPKRLGAVGLLGLCWLVTTEQLRHCYTADKELNASLARWMLAHFGGVLVRKLVECFRWFRVKRLLPNKSHLVIKLHDLRYQLPHTICVKEKKKIILRIWGFFKSLTLLTSSQIIWLPVICQWNCTLHLDCGALCWNLHNSTDYLV